MFGFFKKKAAAPVKSAPSRAAQGGAPEKKGVELSAAQKKLINAELERHGRGEGNHLDASIGLLHMTGDTVYLKGILQFLENSEIGLLLKEPVPGSDFLILTQDHLRYLPIFSRPEHAQMLANKFPAYRHVGLVNSREFFGKIEPGMGLWINPGHSIFTYMMPAAMFTSYVAMLLKKR